MTPTPRCKHCGLTEEEITGTCAMHPRGTHEVIVIASDFDGLPQISGNAEEEAFDAAVFATPAPPADPLMRALWDLEHVVESAPALEPVTICTRAAALAAVHQAIWLRDISHALEDIAHSLARQSEQAERSPEPIKNYREALCPQSEIYPSAGGTMIRCGRPAGHDGPHSYFTVQNPDGSAPEPGPCHHRENTRGVFTRCTRPAGHDGPHNHILERHPFEATRGAAYPDGRNEVLCHCERPARDGIHTCNTQTCNANLMPGHVHNCELGGPYEPPLVQWRPEVPHPEPPPCPTVKEPGPPWYGARCKRPAGHAGKCDFGTEMQAHADFLTAWKDGAE